MWYVKDEFTKKIYFKSIDIRKCQNFANHYNETHKFASQRMFKFNLYTFTSINIFNSHEKIIDINKFTGNWNIFQKPNLIYKHPFAVKKFDKKHKKYINSKLTLIKHLCKKYHLWSYNEHNRKCDEFDF